MSQPTVVAKTERRVKSKISRQFAQLAQAIAERVIYEEKTIDKDIDTLIDN
jgi:F0F1-type ATP synthase membrane subunit b/b'